MDFIVKLLKSKDSAIGLEYDSILTITERMIKYAYFILFLKTISAPKLVYIIT
jgi:hypothetical protein